ncbi:hypothetical protein MCHI_001609 [Candidatus Magnetoovum chiemensis]|nr:hypothetical protein MCHI_001609 [Candidatus Magnetoovum chiemensis]
MDVEYLDISGDIGIRVNGSNAEDIFTNAALALYAMFTNIESIEAAQLRQIKCQASSQERLLIEWLNEIIFQFDVYGFVGKNIQITKLDTSIIEAQVEGEEFNSEKHEKGLLVKAATFHNLKIEHTNTHWSAEVVFDI